MSIRNSEQPETDLCTEVCRNLDRQLSSFWRVDNICWDQKLQVQSAKHKKNSRHVTKYIQTARVFLFLIQMHTPHFCIIYPIPSVCKEDVKMWSLQIKSII